MAQDCIFCKIAGGDVPSDMVYQDEQCVAFRDIRPQAPTHLLVIPRAHIRGMGDLAGADAELLGHLLQVAAQVAAAEGLAQSGYRTVINWGPNSGMEVPHLHLHVLGGRRMSWPPG
ncbi:MAG: histidine triad nucleotide-binding protein [Armatimonadota bacterium]